MKAVILKKKNGIVTEIRNTEENRNEISKAKNENTHICWHYCSNATPSKCEKVRDLRKQVISCYEFIQDGYQIMDENGKLESFVVTKCDHYKEAVKRKKWERR